MPVSVVEEEEGGHEPVFVRYKDVVAAAQLSIEVISVSSKPSLSYQAPNTRTPSHPKDSHQSLLYTMFSREEMFHLETAFTMDSSKTETHLPGDEIEAQASDSESDISVSSNTDSLASSTTVAPLEEAYFTSMEVGLYEHFLFSPDTNSGKPKSSSKAARKTSSWFPWGSRASR